MVKDFCDLPRLIPSLQRLEGKAECFGTGQASCEGIGCDLIMMTSHGWRGVKALLLGSETQKVLTHSKIPVLVYR